MPPLRPLATALLVLAAILAPAARAAAAPPPPPQGRLADAEEWWRLAVDVFHVWRLYAATTDSEAREATVPILLDGGDFANARVLRILLREERSAKGMVVRAALESFPRRALAAVPTFLAEAAAAPDDRARSFPLDLIAGVARANETGEVFVQEDGVAYYHFRPGFTELFPRTQPRRAVFAWAAWLSIHGYVARGDRVLAALRASPDAGDRPRRQALGDGVEVVSVAAGSGAAAAGLREGDLLRALGRSGVSRDYWGILSVAMLRSHLAEMRGLDARFVIAEVRRREGKTEYLRFALPSDDDFACRDVVVVRSVIPDAPAGLAGLRPDDWIRTIDDAPVRSERELEAAIRGKARVVATIERGGVAGDVVIRLEGE